MIKLITVLTNTTNNGQDLSYGFEGIANLQTPARYTGARSIGSDYVLGDVVDKFNIDSASSGCNGLLLNKTRIIYPRLDYLPVFLCKFTLMK